MPESNFTQAFRDLPMLPQKLSLKERWNMIQMPSATTTVIITARVMGVAIIMVTAGLISLIIFMVKKPAAKGGAGKIKKGGISPILLICLSAIAGVAVYGL